MNKVCHYMEESLKEIRVSKKKTPEDVLAIMYDDPHRKFKNIHIDLMNSFYLEYKNVRKKIKMDELFSYSSDGQEMSIAVYCQELKDRIVEALKNESVEYVTDLAIYVCYVLFPSRSKTFVWDLFGEELIMNVYKHKQDTVTVPVLDPNGEIRYLGQNYRLQEVYIDI